MTDPRAHAIQEAADRTRRLVAEVQAMIAETRRILAASRDLLEQADVPSPEQPAASARPVVGPPPDALCAVFDALLEAAHQAERSDDPELFGLVERALLHVGERIERGARALANRDVAIQ